MAYNNAPPPNTMGPATMMNPAMMGGGGGQPTGIDFMAALRKAKEIAEQLKENPNAVTNAANVPPPPQGGPPVQVHANGLQPTLGDFGLLQLVSTSTAPSGVCTEDYYIPNEQIGRVIGKGGESINRLQDVSSCRIQIATDNGTNKRIGTFTGQRENIDKARTMVHDIVAEYLIPQDQQPQDNLTEVPIPADRVGLVIGRSGETIKRLQEESGAKLQMIQDDPLRDYADFKPLRMTGDLAAVEKAKQLVKDLLDTRDPAKMGSQYTSMLDSMLGNGQGNQQQQLEGGPSGGGDGNPGNALAIHGDNNNHNNNDVDTTAFRSIVSEVKVPRFAVGNVIGRGGETIKRLQAESGARVQFEQGDTGPADHRVCTVAGSKEMVAYAEKQIKEIVEECERRDNERRGGGGGGGMGGGMGGGGNKYGPPGGGGQGGPSKSVMVPTQVCGLIIGRGGESIKELQSRSGAHIALDRYAPPGAQEKAFHITGTEEQMNEAERLIKERMNEERDRRGGGGPGGGGGRGPPSGGGGRDFGGGGGGYNRGGPPGGGGPSYGGGYGGPPPGNFPNPGGFPNPYGGGFPNPYGGGPPGGGGYGGGHGGGGGGYGGGPPGMGGQNNYGPPGVQQQQQQQQQPQDSNTNNNNGPPGVQQQQDQSNSASGGGNDQSDAAAVAAGYPTAAEYQANTDWYNSQGYYGVVPM